MRGDKIITAEYRIHARPYGYCRVSLPKGCMAPNCDINLSHSCAQPFQLLIFKPRGKEASIIFKPMGAFMLDQVLARCQEWRTPNRAKALETGESIQAAVTAAFIDPCSSAGWQSWG